ncbi:MAG TPA: cation-transporting P-type ATPase [Patescibacteria group bacterium]|nr:cation-transporting P-type ATPase [Patescibacteria group bacterium]
MNWYQKPYEDVFEELSVKPEEGLSHRQANDRLTAFGPNVLARSKKETILDIFARQFKSPLIYILILAAGFVISLGQTTDAIVILAVIILNSIIGTVQEGKARNSLERLKSLTRHKALVRRAGEENLISTEELVPGDILILHEGDRIGADARIFKAESFKVDEAVLTGEAESITKTADVINKKDLVVGDQKNMLFAGTSVVSGFCEVIVVETGFSSELGKISKSIQESSDVPLPLAQKVLKLTHFIAFAVFLIAAVTLLVGVFRGIEFREILAAVIGLSVSIVPEGLPVAVTIVLAGGVWRMAKNKAIVRQMAAVEAMGNADTLLVDKTGTITTGKMVIKKLNFMGDEVRVDGDGYTPKGTIEKLESQENGKLNKLLSLCYLSLNADVVLDEHRRWQPTGDPTEAAIAVVCKKAGLSKEKLSKEYKVDFAKPFDPQKRYIEASYVKGEENWHVVVGAVDFIAKNLKVDHHILQDYHNLAKKGYRVIGAVVFGPKKSRIFAHALFAIEEEIRPQVAKSVLAAKEAGFRVVMITGDFEETAKAIAEKVGIFEQGDLVITGKNVENFSEVQLEEKIEKASVFARITPGHKLKIVNAYKRKGYVCAMTGDGVNDAPALQAANLGISVGSGTQVAKDSADIVLVDNDFSTIVSAIGEGRAIYATLKKIILYLFSTSFGEVLVISGAVFLGLPLPLFAVQIIWLNFVTDGFFVVGLAQDPPLEKKLLHKNEVVSENLVDRKMILRMSILALAMFAATMPVFYFYQNASNLAVARTMALLILSATQWFNALNVRSKDQSIFRVPLNNRFLIASFVIVFVLQFIAIETSFGNRVLHTVDLDFGQWVLALSVSTLIIWVEEARKLFGRTTNN